MVRKFVEVATKNNNVFMELFFMKTPREAGEVVLGYGTGG